jgi:hypothetical protein
MSLSHKLERTPKFWKLKKFNEKKISCAIFIISYSQLWRKSSNYFFIAQKNMKKNLIEL